MVSPRFYANNIMENQSWKCRVGINHVSDVISLIKMGIQSYKSLFRCPHRVDKSQNVVKTIN